MNAEDKTGVRELVWLYRLRQAEIFDAQASSETFSEPGQWLDMPGVAFQDAVRAMGADDVLEIQFEDGSYQVAVGGRLVPRILVEPRTCNTGVNGRRGNHGKLF